MMTRFSTVTCPKCGHTGKPKVEGGAGALSLIPVVGELAEIHSAANRTLHCAKCGEPLTQSLKSKFQSLQAKAKDWPRP
jgi:ribosomal protein S27E